MFPDRTEVRSVPRFAVDKERASATAHPGWVCLHPAGGVRGDEVLFSVRSPTLLNTLLNSVSLSQLPAPPGY